MSKVILIKFMLAFFAILQTGCLSTRPGGSAVDSSFPLSFEPIVLDGDAEQSAEGVQAKIDAEQFESEIFCKDDVYSTYLRQKYLKDNKNQIYRNKTRRSQNSARKRLETESLFHARTRMSGNLPSFVSSIPVVANAQVEYWIRYFKTRGRHTFLKWLVRGQSVIEVVKPLLHQEGIPEEIFFLGMIESGFSNSAYSSARATGPWQFMKGTALLYGLKINHWVDERRDPVKSTVAAAQYLKDMYTRFSDWYLAMAAYNAGPGKIGRAVRRSRSRDFWEIAQTRYIRPETKHYIPKMLAAAILSQNLEKHGFEVVRNESDMLPQGKAEILRPVRLSEVAQKLGVSYSTVKRWNPEVIRGITPPQKDGQKYELRMPLSFVDKFESIRPQLAQLKVDKVMMYKIRPGDTLSGIAQKHRIRINQIQAINPSLRSRALRVGKKIAIPVPSVTVISSRNATKSG